jgi:hypothetical protein
VTWSWEYEPSEEYVAAGAPPTLIIEVEKRAGELARAAEALYVHGVAYEGLSPSGGTALIPGGMFDYQVIPRHERVYVFQVTAW